jgi:hypothetical protein
MVRRPAAIRFERPSGGTSAREAADRQDREAVLRNPGLANQVRIGTLAFEELESRGGIAAVHPSSAALISARSLNGSRQDSKQGPKFESISSLDTA